MPSECVLLQRLSLGSLSQGDIDAGCFQIRMPKCFLNCLEVCPSGHMMGGHRMSKGMDTGALNVGFSKVFGHAVLNGSGADRPLELTDEQGCFAWDIWTNRQISSYSFTSFVVERNVLSLAAFPSDPHRPHVVRVWCDALGDLNVSELELCQL